MGRGGAQRTATHFLREYATQESVWVSYVQSELKGTEVTMNLNVAVWLTRRGDVVIICSSGSVDAIRIGRSARYRGASFT